MNSINKRQAGILISVIDEFINTNTPVSSNSLFLNYNLGKISPATIRNDFSVLDKFGYLKKQHFTSGRVPTIKGYEYFVNTLLNEAEKSIFENFNNFDYFERTENLFENFRNIIDKLRLPGIFSLIGSKSINFKSGLRFIADYEEFRDRNYLGDFLSIFEDFEKYQRNIFEYFWGIDRHLAVLVGDNKKINKKFKNFSAIFRFIKDRKNRKGIALILFGPHRMNYRQGVKSLSEI